MPTFPVPQLTLIDLDGTLVDTVPDLAYSVDEMLARLGMPRRGEERVREWIGNGAAQLVRRALSGDMAGAENQTEFDRAYALFLELYAQHTCERSRLYPGVPEGLRFLQSTATTLGCITNKPARFTEPLLRALDLYELFALVVSGDSVARKKPDPMPLLYAAEHFGANPEQALFIGDSVSDVRAARAAGFAVICVSYGYNHGTDIRECRPDAVIDSLAELSELIEYVDCK